MLSRQALTFAAAFPSVTVLFLAFLSDHPPFSLTRLTAKAARAASSLKEATSVQSPDQDSEEVIIASSEVHSKDATPFLGREPILFVSDRDEAGNWDIYSLDPQDLSVTRLTNHPAVDNHPSLSEDGSQIVFSSTRGGSNFDLYIMDSIGEPQGAVPTLLYSSLADDRHPHFLEGLNWIVFDSKQKLTTYVDTTVEYSECSAPRRVTTTIKERYFEGMFLIRPDGSGFTAIDLWTNDPGWPPYPPVPNLIYTPAEYASNEGHAEIKEIGGELKLLFSGDGGGDHFEVWTADIDTSTGLASNIA